MSDHTNGNGLSASRADSDVNAKAEDSLIVIVILPILAAIIPFAIE